MSSIDRNAPCPCGSGKKYKKCCAWKDAAARAAATPPAPTEEDFIAEMKPEVDAEVDRLLLKLEQGEHQKIRAQLVALYNKHPSYHMTSYAMGVYVGLIEGDSVRAIPFFQKAVQVFPPFPEAHFNLGTAAMKAGRLGTAVAGFRNAIQYSSGDDGIAEAAKKAIAGMAQIVHKSSPFKTLDALVENQELFERAFENLSQHRYNEAAGMFRRVLEKHPNHVQSYGNLGLCLAGLGEKAAALASLDRALQLDPTYEPARSNRKAIERMTEGKPHELGRIAEIDYSLERLKAQQSQTGAV